MFRQFQKTDILFYGGLGFLAFPVLGIFIFSYPAWTIFPTIAFAFAYIALIHIKDVYQKTIALLWFYLLIYTLYMIYINGNMIWFFFFHNNLLVWRFKDSPRSYRFISYIASVFLVITLGMIYASDAVSRIMLLVVPSFLLLMYFMQHRIQVDDALKAKISKQNSYINLLSAENERNRIGRDLHDTLGHTFAMMTLKTELALKQLDKENLRAVHKELLELNQISKDSMKNVRQLVNNLKYRTVAEELANMTSMFDLSDIELRIDNQLDNNNLSPVIQSSITMILRELTTNVIKHAKAKNCHISLKKDDHLIIEVTDDGIGFDKLTGKELRSIKERLSLVDGQVKIVSRKNPTIIQISLEEGVHSK